MMDMFTRMVPGQSRRVKTDVALSKTPNGTARSDSSSLTSYPRPEVVNSQMCPSIIHCVELPTRKWIGADILRWAAYFDGTARFYGSGVAFGSRRVQLQHFKKQLKHS